MIIIITTTTIMASHCVWSVKFNEARVRLCGVCPRHVQDVHALRQAR